MVKLNLPESLEYEFNVPFSSKKIINLQIELFPVACNQYSFAHGATSDLSRKNLFYEKCGP